MNMPGLALATWRKSSYSDGGDTNCVEVAVDAPGFAAVRDSKAPTGPALLIPMPVWAVFIDGVRRTI